MAASIALACGDRAAILRVTSLSAVQGRVRDPVVICGTIDADKGNFIDVTRPGDAPV